MYLISPGEERRGEGPRRPPDPALIGAAQGSSSLSACHWPRCCRHDPGHGPRSLTLHEVKSYPHSTAILEKNPEQQRPRRTHAASLICHAAGPVDHGATVTGATRARAKPPHPAGTRQHTALALGVAVHRGLHRLTRSTPAVLPRAGAQATGPLGTFPGARGGGRDDVC